MYEICIHLSLVTADIADHHGTGYYYWELRADLLTPPHYVVWRVLFSFSFSFSSYPFFLSVSLSLSLSACASSLQTAPNE
jgi:hypothetical protein